MPLPHVRHDALFRLTVSDPGRAGEMLQYCLPPEVAARMDPNRSPVLIDGTAINAEGVRTHADAIFRVHLKGDDDLLVLVIFEHKANLDYRTPLQVLQYMLRQWMIEMDTGTAANGRLSLILPIIFYHGKAEWSVPLSIQDMIHAPNGLEHLTRSFGHYQLENLGHMDADDLSFNIELRAALLALARAFRDHISDDEADILVAGIAETELGRYIQTYIIEQISLPPERMEAALRRIGTAPDRLEDIMGTAAQIWMQQGREEGLAVGEELGRAKGKAEGKAEDLTRLLQRRFGPLPAPIEARIAAASVPELDAWLDSLLDASSLDEVFAGSSGH